MRFPGLESIGGLIGLVLDGFHSDSRSVADIDPDDNNDPVDKPSRHNKAQVPSTAAVKKTESEEEEREKDR